MDTSPSSPSYCVATTNEALRQRQATQAAITARRVKIGERRSKYFFFLLVPFRGRFKNRQSAGAR